MMCFGENRRKKEAQEQHDLNTRRHEEYYRNQHDRLNSQHKEDRQNISRQNTELISTRRENFWLYGRILDQQPRRAGNNIYTATSTQTNLALAPQRRGTA
jgi:hypothetical protein